MARLLTFVLFAALFVAYVAAACNHACTDDYTPVCGMNRDGFIKTFSNLCELNIEQCENPAVGWYMARTGECRITN